MGLWWGSGEAPLFPWGLSWPAHMRGHVGGRMHPDPAVTRVGVEVGGGLPPGGVFFAGTRYHLQQEPGRNESISLYLKHSMICTKYYDYSGLAIIDSPTQPFSLRAVRFTNSTIF